MELNTSVNTTPSNSKSPDIKFQTETEHSKTELTVTMGSIEEEFEKAAKYIRELPKQGKVVVIGESGTYKASSEAKLMFYGLYKQATEGPCIGSKPLKILFDARAKWEAWHKLGELSKMEAMEKYVEEFKKVKKAYEKSSAAQES